MKFLLKKFFRIILFSKFDFLIPKKNKILIFDKIGSDFIDKYFSKEDIHVLYTRRERLNFYVIILNLLKGKFTTLDYFETYINCVSPKIVMTGIDNYPIFYKIKENPNRKKIVVASAWRTEVHDTDMFKMLSSEEKEYNVDYVFTINDSIGKFFKNKLNAKNVISIGSFKSNYFESEESIKNKEMVFVSSFSQNYVFLKNKNKKVTSEISYIDYDNYQKNLLANLCKYIEEHNSSITILGKADHRFVDLEYQYYKDIFKDKNWNFIKRGETNSYKTVDSFKIVLGLNSTLVYESFSRGNKTIFFDIRSHLETLKTLRFAWPVENLDKDGPFWTRDNSYEGLKKIINNVKNMDENSWKNLHNNYINKIMPQDKKNSNFVSIVNKFL